jgi:hypothetical protein
MNQKNIFEPYRWQAARLILTDWESLATVNNAVAIEQCLAAGRHLTYFKNLSGQIIEVGWDRVLKQ